MIIWIGVVLVIIITIFLGITGGYFKYVYAYVKCGTSPVAVSKHFGEYKADYMLPGDQSYPGPNMFMKYVCTEKEAIGLGAKHYPTENL